LKKTKSSASLRVLLRKVGPKSGAKENLDGDPLVLSYPLPDFISLGKFSQTRAKFVLIETLFKLEGI
jgi:hypothetical protein